MLEPVADLDQLLGGLHEWRDVQAVIRTIFQALCDVAHAQSHAVREVEKKTGEIQEELTQSLNRKADVSDLRAAAAAAGEAKAATDYLAQRVDEEAQSALEAQHTASEEVQALRSGLLELRAALEKQRASVEQWRAGVEAGLSRIVSECSNDVHAVRESHKAALEQQAKDLVTEIHKRAPAREVQDLSHKLDQTCEGLRAAVEERATPAQLKEIVREAWTREEGHLARLQRLCESKVSVADFASLAALAEGKASLADVDAAVQRQVQKRLQSFVIDHNFLNRADVSGIAEAAVVDSKERLRECERRMEDLLRKQQRSTSVAEELRTEIKGVAASKLERVEAEAMVAGALADWVRAAQRGADAVQAAVVRGRARDSGSSPDLGASDLSFGTSFCNDSYLVAAEEAARSPGLIPWRHQEGISAQQSRWTRGPVRVTSSPAPRAGHVFQTSPSHCSSASALGGARAPSSQRRPSVSHAASCAHRSAGPKARVRSQERGR